MDPCQSLDRAAGQCEPVFTPLVNRPASRGEVMLFALPDAIIVLMARIVSYPVTDVHRRAMRQHMILA